MATFIGGSTADTLNGSAERDYFAGLGGDDTIDSGAGNDWIEGGTGADTFVFNPGCGWDCVGDFAAADGDLIDLRAWTNIRSMADLVIESDGSGTSIVFGPHDGVRLMGVAADALTPDRFLFADGSAPAGGSGGSPGVPGLTLNGTAANDALIGGAGNDTVTAGAGFDYIVGGAGSDRIVAAPGDSWDYVEDFQAGAGGDVLDLRAWTNITSIADLIIESDESGTSVVFGPEDGMRLNGVAAGMLNDGNFLFAGQTGGDEGEPGGDTGGGDTGGEPGGTPGGGTHRVLYASMYRADTGHELYRLDLDQPGAAPTLVADLTPGAGNGYPESLLAVGDTLYFVGQTANHDHHLYRLDTTAPGAQPEVVAQYNYAENPAFPIGGLTLVGNDLYFTNRTMQSGLEMYRLRTDQPGATPELLDLMPGAGSSNPTPPVHHDGKLYFVAQDTRAPEHRQIYSLDAARPQDPPVRITDLPNDHGWPGELAIAGDRLYFVDGNTLRSISLSNPDAGLTSYGLSGVNSLEIVGDTLYCGGSRGNSAGNELYRLDVTNPNAQPVLVADMLPNGSSAPSSLMAVGDDLFFTAADANWARELYHLDLATQGAVPDQVSTGLGAGSPYALNHFQNVGGDLYFTAIDRTSGGAVYRVATGMDDLVPERVATLAPESNGWGSATFAVMGG